MSTCRLISDGRGSPPARGSSTAFQPPGDGAPGVRQMTRMTTATAIAALTMLSGCGGDSGGGTPTPAPAPTIATLAVTLSASSQTTTIGDDGSGTPLDFTASVAGSTADTVIADLQYDRSRLALDGDVVRASDGSYKVRFKPASGLALGSYDGSVTFRLCRDTGCGTVYPGSNADLRLSPDDAARRLDDVSAQRCAHRLCPRDFRSRRLPQGLGLVADGGDAGGGDRHGERPCLCHHAGTRRHRDAARVGERHRRGPLGAMRSARRPISARPRSATAASSSRR